VTIFPLLFIEAVNSWSRVEWFNHLFHLLRDNSRPCNANE
jgi:hypothetical protein